MGYIADHIGCRPGDLCPSRPSPDAAEPDRLARMGRTLAEPRSDRGHGCLDRTGDFSAGWQMVAACFQHRAARCDPHFSSGNKNAQLAGNRCRRDCYSHGFAVLVVRVYLKLNQGKAARGNLLPGYPQMLLLFSLVFEQFNRQF